MPSLQSPLVDAPKPFFEHLEDLRFCLLKCMAAVFAATVLSYYMIVDPAIAYLAKPVGKFIFLQPTEAFFVRLKVAVASGLLLALPLVLYQLWGFVVIALTPQERKSLIWILPASYALFLSGSAFGLFILVPKGVEFLLGYSSPYLTPNLSIEFYVNFVGIICLSLGAIFQMPLITFFASKFGLIHYQLLTEKRRLAILLIYILSAVVTPGPDPVTALLLALPTYLIFECSILTAKMAASPSELH